MTTQNGPSTENAMVLTPRQEKLQTLRDDMSPGSRPAAIVPRNFAEAQAMCGALARSGLVPHAYIDKPENMIVTIMAGAEIGLPPMAALRLYHIMDNIPRLSAEGIRAVLISHPDIEYFEPLTGDDKQATWIGKRRGRPEKSATWTVERAKRAGLWDRKNRDGSPGNWQKYTEDMLNARASMQLGRLIAPDIVAGMVSREEAEDGDFVQVESKEAPAFTAAPVSYRQALGLSAPPAPNPKDVITPTQSGATASTGDPVRAIGGASGASPTNAPETPAKRGPGRPPKNPTQPAASTSSPKPSESTSTTATGSNSTAELAVSFRENPAAPIEGSATVDRWGQAIDAGPTSADSNTEPSPSAESAPTSSQENGAGDSLDRASADDPVEDGFGEDAPAPAGVVLREFNDWVMSCKNQRDLGAGLPKWRAWSKDQHAKGDARFAKGGELTNAMQDAYSRRKGEVPA